MNALKKITTRAKALRKKKPGMSWKSAIKSAGVDYRAGRLGTIKKAKTKYRQTGTSSAVQDSRLRAKRPGKRKSASGKTYYERRKNRSDVPFALTGIENKKPFTLLQAKRILKSGGNLSTREKYILKMGSLKLKHMQPGVWAIESPTAGFWFAYKFPGRKDFSIIA